jgi:hypothetical protein
LQDLIALLDKRVVSVEAELEALRRVRPRGESTRPRPQGPPPLPISAAERNPRHSTVDITEVAELIESPPDPMLPTTRR